MYVFKQGFLENFPFFDIFSSPNQKCSLKYPCPWMTKMSRKHEGTFWFGLEKYWRKNYYTTFEHIPNASAVQFWAPNSSSTTVPRGKRSKVIDVFFILLQSWPNAFKCGFRAFIVKLGDDDNAAPPLVESSIANRSKTALGCAISCIKLTPTYPDKKSPQLTE